MFVTVFEEYISSVVYFIKEKFVWKYQRGNQQPYIEWQINGQKEKGQKDKNGPQSKLCSISA